MVITKQTQTFILIVTVNTLIVVNELFNPKTVNKLCSKIELSSEQEDAAKEWINLLDRGLLKDEKNNYFKFAEIILKSLLGYNIKDDMFHEKGNIEFSFKNKDDKTVLGIEVKGTDKDLFAEQRGYREWQKTPVHQLWNYMGDLNLDYGIATNYKHFVLIGRKGTSAIHYFDFEEIINNKDKLKEFVGIFSKEQIIDKRFIEYLEKASAIEEREFTKEFYKLFNETRLMMVKEFQENGANKDKAIHYSQLFLNRLMFVFFAEDTGKLKTRLFEDSVISVLKAEMTISNQSHQVSDMIRNLFTMLDTGSEIPNIFGFNGGLFHEEIQNNIFFNDLRDKEIFKDVYQNSKLIKELKLDDVSKPVFDKYQNKLNPIIRNLVLMALFDFKTEISVNILGHIFEQSLSDLEVLKEGEVSKRKKDGVFYTPEYITDYICRNTIISYLSKENARNPHDLILEHSSNIKELESKLNDIKIVDPACGSGAFLIKAVDVLLELFKEIQMLKLSEGVYTPVKKGRKKIKDKGQVMLKKWHEEDEAREIIKNNIYGVDINEESVEITKLSLFLKIARTGEKLIDLSKNIKCGNSLIGDLEVDSKAFNWTQEFKEIFDNGGFDIVVGNPPWGADIEFEKLNFIKSENEEIVVRMIDSFMFFTNISLNLVSDYGCVGMIVPDVLLYQKDNEKLRKSILKKMNLFYIVNLGDSVFEDVSRPSCIVIIGGKTTKYVNVVDVSKVKENKKELYNYLMVSNELYNSTPMNIFPTNNIEGYEILKRLSSFPSLVESIDSDNIQRGVSPDLKDAFIVDLEKINRFQLEKNKLKKTVTGGKDVKRYFITENQDDLIYNTRDDDFTLIPNICKYISSYEDKITCKEVKNGKHPLYALHRPRDYKIFEKSEKILGVITGDRIITAVDVDKIYPTDGIYVFSTKEGISPKYMVSLLNSKLFTFLYRLFSLEAGRTLSQIKPVTLRMIPFIEIPFEKQKPFIEKADLMQKLTREFYNNRIKLLNRVKQKLKLENNSKKLDGFYKLSFEDFVKELEKKNIEPSLKELDEWEDYFNHHKKELLKLEEHIYKIDCEIDKMVFDIYDFSDDEIKIVNDSNV